MTTESLVLPTQHDIETARSSQRELAAYLSTKTETQHIQFLDDNNMPHAIELPTSAIRLLVEVLSELASGNAVKVIPVHAELTTQEAADLLNVSRPHVVKLLEETMELPFHKTGKHRRIKFADLMNYKQKRDTRSEDILKTLSEEAQELNLGY